MVKGVSFWGLFIVPRRWSLIRFSPVPNSLIGKFVTAIFLKEPLKIKETRKCPSRILLNQSVIDDEYY